MEQFTIDKQLSLTPINGGTATIHHFRDLMWIVLIIYRNVFLQAMVRCGDRQTDRRDGGLEEGIGVLVGVHRIHCVGI